AAEASATPAATTSRPRTSGRKRSGLTRRAAPSPAQFPPTAAGPARPLPRPGPRRGGGPGDRRRRPDVEPDDPGAEHEWQQGEVGDGDERGRRGPERVLLHPGRLEHEDDGRPADAERTAQCPRHDAGPDLECRTFAPQVEAAGEHTD